MSLTLHFNLTPFTKKYDDEDLRRYWPACCPKCGWRGLSRDAAGGHPLGESGDYDDVVCPDCTKQHRWSPLEDDDDLNKPRPRLFIQPLFAWYDLWIGLYYDRKAKTFYLLPFPCVGMKLWLRW